MIYFNIYIYMAHSYDKIPITLDEFEKWQFNKSINPRTGKYISNNGKIYKYLENNFRGTETFGKSSPGAFSEYDPNLNVVRSDDYGFTGFYFTTDSNF